MRICESNERARGGEQDAVHEDAGSDIGSSQDAYVDPSVMSYTVQAIAGVVIALGVVFGVVWRKVKKGANKALGRDENAGKEVEEDVVRRDS